MSDVVEYESIKRMHSTSPGDGKKRKKIEKTEVEKVQGEFQKYKKESEKKYNELREENQKLKEENDKLQTEKAIAESKLEAEANVRKTKKNTDKHEITADDMSDCIDKLSSMKLIQMKTMGGQRTSPSEEAKQRALFPCHLCDFSSDSQSVWDKHLKDNHRNIYNCPFCTNTFNELTLVRNHIHLKHKEDKMQEKTIYKVKPCAFFNQRNGCKKKDQCDFSHDISVLDQGNIKVPKLCWNGPWCRWKPRCRYVHTEDGEVIPPRGERLGFGQMDRRQPPPGYSVSSGRQTTLQQRSAQQGPDLRNMAQFPGLKMTMNMTEVWV